MCMQPLLLKTKNEFYMYASLRNSHLGTSYTPNMIGVAGVAYYRFAIITPAAPTNNLFIPIALTKPLAIP